MVVLTWRCSNKNWERFCICFWLLVLQTHTVTRVCFLTSLLMRSPASGRRNALGISQETAVGRWWKYQPGNWITRFHLDIWLHGWCHFFVPRQLGFCLYALTLEGERQKDLRVISKFRMQIGKFGNLYSRFPIQASVFCNIFRLVQPSGISSDIYVTAVHCWVFKVQVQNHPSAFVKHKSWGSGKHYCLNLYPCRGNCFPLNHFIILLLLL